MWDYYKRTFIPTQVLIAIITLALVLHWGVPPLSAVFFVIVMEVASFGGAAWAAGLRRKILAGRGPSLEDRR